MQGLWAAAWLKDVGHLPRLDVIEFLFVLALMLALAAFLNGMITSFFRRRGLSHAAQLAIVAMLQIGSEIALGYGVAVNPLVPWSIIAMSGAGTVIGFSANVERFDKALLARANSVLTIGHMLGALMVQAGFGMVLELWQPDIVGSYPIAAYRMALLAVAGMQGLAILHLVARSATRSVLPSDTSELAPIASPAIVVPVRPTTAVLPYLVALFAFQAVGEVATRFFDLRLPGPLLGMLGLLIALAPRRAAPNDLKLVARFLIEHLNLFFIPAGAALISVTHLLGNDLIALLVAVVIATPVGIAVTALTASQLLRLAKVGLRRPTSALPAFVARHELYAPRETP
ncbi:MAG: CidA/LrgA family protein, partial [Proteobacteria bacterium]|nr:CidA/LrgA family protein [Pseudomonadota bacterium]